MSLLNLPDVRALQRPAWLAFQTPDQSAVLYDPVLAAAQDQDDAAISIYGQIGVDPFSSADNSERRIGRALRAIGEKDVTVNINSPGGNFFSGLAIYNLLRLHRAKVTVQVIGMAGSAASIIAMAGDDILMADGSQLVLHNASGVTIGNKFDTREATDVLGEIDAAMAEIYAVRAGVEIKDATDWMDRARGAGTFFNTARALEAGLATGRLEASAVSACLEEPQQAPAERVLENALVAASNMRPKDAKAFLSEFKAGTRDAAAAVTRDADAVSEALRALRQTLTSS